MLDALVIGAGMAGMTAARELRRAGLLVRVLEARDRIGGRVLSVRDFAAGAVEGGAEFVHGVEAATWPEIRDARLTARPCSFVRHTMLNLGNGSRWLPLALLHPGTWPSFTLLRRVSRSRATDLSALQFIEREGYRGRARLLAEMTLAGHLPGSLEEVGVRGLIDDGVLRLETGLNHRLVEGYDRLPAHVGREVEVDLGFRVEVVRWGPDGVSVTSSDGREIGARAAVCTLPVGVCRSGSVRFEPGLPAGKRASLESLRMGPVVKILLRFRERFWPRRLALLVCGTGPVNVWWTPFHGAVDAEPVLVAYATGPRAARLSAATEDASIATAVDDLRRLFPRADAGRQLVACRRIDWAQDPFSCGGYSFILPGGAGSRAGLAAADTGALFWAGSATESSPIAETVEAAYLSGLRAAREVGSELQ